MDRINLTVNVYWTLGVICRLFLSSYLPLCLAAGMEFKMEEELSDSLADNATRPR